MKEFDIEKAKAGAPICTRGGRPARIVCFNVKCEDRDNFNILALVTNNKGAEDAMWYKEDGIAFYDTDKRARSFDLMMATTKHEGWVLIDPEGPHCIAHIYNSKEEAEEDAEREMIDYSAIARIEWEE